MIYCFLQHSFLINFVHLNYVKHDYFFQPYQTRIEYNSLTVCQSFACSPNKYNCNVTLTNLGAHPYIGRFFHLPYLSVNNAGQLLSHAAADLSLVK